jgi:hypothetical protein
MKLNVGSFLSRQVTDLTLSWPNHFAVERRLDFNTIAVQYWIAKPIGVEPVEADPTYEFWE